MTSDMRSTDFAQIDPKHFITFFPKLEAYERDLSARTRTEDEDRVLTSLRVLLEWLRTNYRQTLARVSSLLANGEITFDLMYALLVPGSIIIRRCPVTRETRALRLVSAHRQKNNCGEFFALDCVGVEEMVGDGDNDDDDDDGRPTMLGWTDDDLKKRQFGMVTDRAVVWEFPGVQKINTLAAYPMDYHPDPSALTATLVARARRWMSLSGVHHMHYRGTASRVEWVGEKQKLVKYSVRLSYPLSFLISHSLCCLHRSSHGSWSTKGASTELTQTTSCLLQTGLWLAGIVQTH